MDISISKSSVTIEDRTITKIGNGCFINFDEFQLFYSKSGKPIIMCFDTCFGVNIGNTLILDYIINMIDSGTIDYDVCHEALELMDVVVRKFYDVNKKVYSFDSPSQSNREKASIFNKVELICICGNDVLYADKHLFNVDREFARLLMNEEISASDGLASIFDQIDLIMN